MDHSLENHKSYIGKPISELPTPSLIINLPILKQNINTLHHDVEKLGIGFRPHVKTLKVRVTSIAHSRKLTISVVSRGDEDDARWR